MELPPPIAYACNVYRRRLGAWPRQMRLSPTFASGFMTELEPDDLERLAQRFEIHLTSTETGRVTVVGDEGQITYDGDVAGEDWDTSAFYRYLDS